MGFSQNGVIDYRKEYNLFDPIDREIIRVFEREIEEIEARGPIVIMKNTIFERKLFGYEVYLLENNLRIFSREYPSGAIVKQNLGRFQDAEMKKKALDDLRWRRKRVEEEKSSAIESLVNGNEVEAPKEKLKKLKKKMKLNK